MTSQMANTIKWTSRKPCYRGDKPQVASMANCNNNIRNLSKSLPAVSSMQCGLCANRVFGSHFSLLNIISLAVFQCDENIPATVHALIICSNKSGWLPTTTYKTLAGTSSGLGALLFHMTDAVTTSFCTKNSGTSLTNPSSPNTGWFGKRAFLIAVTVPACMVNCWSPFLTLAGHELVASPLEVGVNILAQLLPGMLLAQGGRNTDCFSYSVVLCWPSLSDLVNISLSSLATSLFQPARYRILVRRTIPFSCSWKKITYNSWCTRPTSPPITSQITEGSTCPIPAWWLVQTTTSLYRFDPFFAIYRGHSKMSLPLA